MVTEIINCHVKEESEKLSVFQQGGVYLATKKIGKNNSKEAEIRADNVARQEWNRTVDVALVEGVPEEDILKVKQEEITAKKVQSIRAHGWLPDMFRQKNNVWEWIGRMNDIQACAREIVDGEIIYQ